jgi:hypothetical protein
MCYKEKRVKNEKIHKPYKILSFDLPKSLAHCEIYR